jgi:hypothetical protein
MRIYKKTIKEKNEYFNYMHLGRSADNLERYKVAKNTTKWALSGAMSQIYDGLSRDGHKERGEEHL